MSAFHSIGSQIQLVFQTKFPTFTPDQFSQALKEKSFQMAQSQAVSPQGQMIQVQIFSKGNLMVFLLPNPPPSPAQIVFQILNTLNLATATGQTSVIDDITQILGRLNVVRDVIAAIVFSCTTMIQATKEPVKGLASIVKDDFLQKTAQELEMDSLNVTSLRLATTFPIESEKRGFQLTLEPLGTNPKTQYYVQIVYKTDDEQEFDQFIRHFGEQFIQNIRRILGE